MFRRSGIQSVCTCNASSATRKYPSEPAPPQRRQGACVAASKHAKAPGEGLAQRDDSAAPVRARRVVRRPGDCVLQMVALRARDT